MAWKFILRDLSGTALGELTNATNRELAIPLNGLPTCSFVIQNEEPLVERLLEGEVILSVYEGTALRYHGDLITSEEVVSDSGGSIAVTTAGLLWRLSKRLMGTDSTGWIHGDPITQYDRGQLAFTALDYQNGLSNTGIHLGSRIDSSTGYISDPPWRFKKLSEGIGELSASMDGFDFEIEPVEPQLVGGKLRLGLLNIAPAMGVDRPNVAFEYGDGKHNVSSWKRAVDRSGLLNVGFHVPPSDSADPVVFAADADSIAARGRMEEVVEGSVIALPLRQRLVDEHVRVRRYPRQIIGFTPALSTYSYGTDFELGDTVRVRAKVGGETRIDAAVRVYGVAWKDTPRGDLALSEVNTVNEDLFG